MQYTTFPCPFQQTCQLYLSLSEKIRKERCNVQKTVSESLDIEDIVSLTAEVVSKLSNQCGLYRQKLSGAELNEDDIRDLLLVN